MVCAAKRWGPQLKDLLHHIYSARDGALRLLLMVERLDTYANLALQKVPTTGLSTADMAFLTELVYGALRHQGTLDWVINQYSNMPVDRMHDVVRNILRLGTYQLLFMDKVPDSAAVNTAVELTRAWKLKGLSGFVNGVLRTIARRRENIAYPDLLTDPVRHISYKHSHPQWLVRRWLTRFGTDETIALCTANNETPPMSVRCNTLKISVEQLRCEFNKAGLSASSSLLVPDGLQVERMNRITAMPAFQSGLFVVQDESSMLVSHVLGPKPGAVVVDSCAGPGGKATHLAQLMENRGRLWAFDIHEHRLQLIKATAGRLGIDIIETCPGDATNLPEQLYETADYLLIDAPCSGLGVIRRRPDLRWKVREADLDRHARQQLALLNGSIACLKKGCSLIYSTCSTEPEENIGVIRSFLKTHSEFELSDITDLLPFTLESEEDRLEAGQGYLQLLPQRYNTDGFFLAYLRKKKEGG